MKRALAILLLAQGVVAIVVALYVHSHPLVFNESCWEHAHCIKCAGLTLHGYAGRHDGRFPSDPKGYGNALLQLDEESYFALTGPGYDVTPFHEAKRNGTDVAEDDCGRVYVQGLNLKSDGRIALLFDKLPTPGGDHCHFPQRLWAPLGREVWLVGGHSEFIRESEWPEFAKNQIELLVREGIARAEADRLYASQPRQ
jgi:hypothetical protein